MKPYCRVDVTDAVYQNMVESPRRFTRCHVYPFTFTGARHETGSRQWMVEFRPMRKFALTFAFFWKARGVD